MKDMQKLHSFFHNSKREFAIVKAIEFGFKQNKIASFLNLTPSRISSIYKTHKQKKVLFEKMKGKGYFYSYDKSIKYEEKTENIFIQYVLKYGDFDDIVLAFKLFNTNLIKQVWLKDMASEQSFIKTNLLLARVFFKMDVESDFFKKMKYARFEKLKLSAS